MYRHVDAYPRRPLLGVGGSPGGRGESLVIHAAGVFLRRTGEKAPEKDLRGVSAESGGTRDEPP
jgi:hypothetical protein